LSFAAQMGNAMEGGEMKAALWTMALLLFLISLLFITIIMTIATAKASPNALASPNTIPEMTPGNAAGITTR